MGRKAMRNRIVSERRCVGPKIQWKERETRPRQRTGKRKRNLRRPHQDRFGATPWRRTCSFVGQNASRFISVG